MLGRFRCNSSGFTYSAKKCFKSREKRKIFDKFLQLKSPNFLFYVLVARIVELKRGKKTIFARILIEENKNSISKRTNNFPLKFYVTHIPFAISSIILEITYVICPRQVAFWEFLARAHFTKNKATRLGLALTSTCCVWPHACPCGFEPRRACSVPSPAIAGCATKAYAHACRWLAGISPSRSFGWIATVT